MLENFRKRDGSAQRPPTPYGQLQAALSPAAPVDLPKPETQKTESRQDPPQTQRAGDAVSKLIVGPDIKLKGAEITDCDTLVVEGRVEASMDSRVIQIAERGVFVGNVCIDIAEIHGRFEGELTARKQLVIHATGHVSGKIRYGKVSIEEGGELSGDIASIASATATSSEQGRNGAAAVFPTPSAPAANGVLIARQSVAQR